MQGSAPERPSPTRESPAPDEATSGPQPPAPSNWPTYSDLPQHWREVRQASHARFRTGSPQYRTDCRHMLRRYCRALRSRSRQAAPACPRRSTPPSWPAICPRPRDRRDASRTRSTIVRGHLCSPFGHGSSRLAESFRSCRSQHRNRGPAVAGGFPIALEEGRGTLAPNPAPHPPRDTSPIHPASRRQPRHPEGSPPVRASASALVLWQRKSRPCAHAALQWIGVCEP
jgi:hypothetical protein